MTYEEREHFRERIKDLNDEVRNHLHFRTQAEYKVKRLLRELVEFAERVTFDQKWLSQIRTYIRQLAGRPIFDDYHNQPGHTIDECCILEGMIDDLRRERDEARGRASNLEREVAKCQRMVMERIEAINELNAECKRLRTALDAMRERHAGGE